MASVSWASVAAGAVVAAAVSLALLALGSGLGLSSVSPWSETPGSRRLHSKSGLASILCWSQSCPQRLADIWRPAFRTKWTGIHTNESFFQTHGTA